MISVKCGKCGMVHNLAENMLAGNGYGRTCPNCNEPYPREFEKALITYSIAVSRSDNWKAYIIPDPEELRKLQL